MRSFLFYCLVFILSTVSNVSAWTTYVVPHKQGQDDTPALMAALATHTSSATILFQSGVTYNIFTPVKFPVLSNVEISIQGNLSYPTDIATVQSKYDDMLNFAGTYLWTRHCLIFCKQLMLI
jgi:hypothetical protein